MVQFMGKDNVPFHTVIFPATLLGTGEDWTMMRNISVTEYLNYEGGKFSKSRSTGMSVYAWIPRPHVSYVHAAPPYFISLMYFKTPEVSKTIHGGISSS